MIALKLDKFALLELKLIMQPNKLLFKIIAQVKIA